MVFWAIFGDLCVFDGCECVFQSLIYLVWPKYEPVVVILGHTRLPSVVDPYMFTDFLNLIVSYITRGGG